MTKTAMGYLAEANDIVPRLSVEEAMAKHGGDDVVIIDVRDGKAIDETGTIKGALRIPRGFIEFAADETTDFHNQALAKDKEILVEKTVDGGNFASRLKPKYKEIQRKNLQSVQKPRFSTYVFEYFRIFPKASERI